MNFYDIQGVRDLIALVYVKEQYNICPNCHSVRKKSSKIYKIIDTKY